MPLIITHRPDGLLQENVAKERDENDQSYFARVSLPAHQALVRFVDERLATKSFDDKAEISTTLEEWQSFYFQVHGRNPDMDWAQLYVAGDGRLMARTRGLGGDFCFGMVIDAKSVSMTPSNTPALSRS